MAEKLPPGELVSMYGDFLKKHFHVGNPAALQRWLADPRAKELEQKYPYKDMSKLTEAQMHESFELMGEHYGFMINIPDQKIILSRILPNIKDVKTLSIGCGLAPQELFLATQGVLTDEIVGTDVAGSVLARAKQIADELGIQNISFKQKAGGEIDYKQEFDQVLALDSLHWIRGWRNVVRNISQALRPGGTATVVYSRFSPRVQINEMAFVEEMTKQGMDVVELERLRSHADSIRVFAHAVKRTPATIFIPSVSR